MARQTITVRRAENGERIAWVLDGLPVIDMDWRVALDVCAALRAQVRAARAGGPPLQPEIAVRVGGVELSIRVEGNTVLVIGGGRLLFSMPARPAEQLWRATASQARKAEEWANADQVIADGALMFRTGAPFGMTDHPVLQDELVKHAVHDRDLRRYLPGGVKSTVILGAPTITLGTIPAEQKIRKLLRTASPAQRLSVRETLAAVR